MLSSIYSEDIKLWNFVQTVFKDGDVEYEDDETDNSEKNEEKEATPDPEDDIFREHEETHALTGCL